MAYTKVNFTNEIPATSPVKFKITDDSSGVIANSAKIELVTSVTPGTPLNATTLNHMDDGIYNAQVAADAAQADADTAQASANAAQAAATAALAYAPVLASVSKTSFTISATSLADITGFSVSLSLAAKSKVVAWFTGTIYDATGNLLTTACIAITQDGATSYSQTVTTRVNSAGNQIPASIIWSAGSYYAVGVAGSVTIKIMANVNSGSTQLLNGHLVVMAIKE